MTDSLAPRLRFLPLALAVILLDVVTKSLVTSRFAPYDTLPIIDGLLNLTYVRNPGGVFGMLRDLDAGLRSVLFTVIPSVAILLIAYYAWRVPPHRRLTHASLALILGGALGNLGDRLRLGFVVDFIDVYWRDHHWPAFNVADSAICVGVSLLILEMLREEPRPDEPPEKAP